MITHDNFRKAYKEIEVEFYQYKGAEGELEELCKVLDNYYSDDFRVAKRDPYEIISFDGNTVARYKIPPGTFITLEHEYPRVWPPEEFKRRYSLAKRPPSDYPINMEDII